MRVTELRLVNFRNYSIARIQPDAGFCVLTGQNGAGKTNVLEAVFLCALGRSHRTAHDNELIRQGEDVGSVALSVQTRSASGRGSVRRIRIALAAKERKKLSLDDTPLSRSGELMGCLNVVMFSPEDLTLVKGGPAERRRFMDMELSQLRPAYYYSLQQYNAALKQRNTLLKEDTAALDTLELWDEQLSRLGGVITAARANFLEEISSDALTRHRTISGATEELVISYEPNLAVCTDAKAAGSEMRERLADSLERDLYRGSTSVGPHRDDIALVLNGVDARSFGSQGQQRTIALSLKLSVIELMRRVRGESPVLLLDDVFSELDPVRQKQLIQSINGCQTFIACTHLEELVRAGADSMQVFNVKNGTIIEV